MKIKAINTKYKGYYFRSRLEARWAVYFDSMDLKWEYEKEGFNFGNGINYLPDFWFPELEMWGEVKPTELNKDEMDKVALLVKGTHKHCIILSGIPERKPYEIIFPDIDVYGKPLIDGSGETGYYCNGEFYEYPGEELNITLLSTNCAISNYHNYPKNEGRFYTAFDDAEINEDYFNDIDRHVENAKSARFEFNNKK